MNITPEARDDLLKAAEYLSEHNWTKGNFVERDKDGNESVCVLGAFTRAVGNSYCQGTVALHRHLVDVGLIPDEMYSPAVWNDRPDVTKEDVILKLKELAHHDS